MIKTNKKIVDYKNLKELIKQLKNKSIVLVGGCFDLIHLGHLKFLKAAKREGEILIIALESDENIKKLKGKRRPINYQGVRAENLAKLEFVDQIILLPIMKKNQEYQDLVNKVKPKVIAVTENDPLIEKKKVEAQRIKAKVIEVIPYLKNYSTTKILNKSF